MRPQISLSRQRGTGFLADYTVGRIARTGDAVLGVPLLRYGRDGHGQRVLIRTWPHSGPAQAALRPFWLEEVRWLRAFGAKRDGEDLVSRMLDAGADASGFHLIVQCGHRRLLGDLVDHSQATLWESVPERVCLWRNLIRLAKALQILHEQGVTHRSLDHWAVLTEGPLAADFQLTGFEWATRLARNSDQATDSVTAAADDKDYGPSRDWRAYASLAMDLFQLGDVARLDAREHKVIRMLQADTKLDGHRVEAAIAEVTRHLSPTEAGAPARTSKTSTWDAGIDAQGLLLIQVLQSVMVRAIS